MKRGDLVYDKEEPRHIGVVLSKHTDGNVWAVNVRWLETGWITHRIPMRRLRKASQARCADEVQQMKQRLAKRG